jgi:hypothetical protein
MSGDNGAPPAALVALAGQAERGEPCVRVTLLTAAGLVQGYPASRSAFHAATTEAVRAATDSGRRRLMGSKQAVDSALPAQLAMVTETSGAPDQMYLVPAALIQMTGSSLSIPAMQVSLLHVIAWWLGKADVHQAKSYAAAFGVAVPID